MLADTSSAQAGPWYVPCSEYIDVAVIRTRMVRRTKTSVQHVSASLSQPGIDLRAMSGFLQLLESLMPETLDHAHNVPPRVSCVKYYVTSRLSDMQRLPPRHSVHSLFETMVRPEGFEPPTLRSEV